MKMKLGGPRGGVARYLRGAAAQSITMASTTSTEQSGLFAYLLPEFKKASGLDVKVVAVGTGQAIDMARRGDADVLFVHDQVAEEKFVADGFAARRYPVMYNDFVLVGPKADPASTKQDLVAALKKVAAAMRLSSRAATRAAPRRRTALLVAGRPGNAKGSGYKECGCGMGRRSTSAPLQRLRADEPAAPVLTSRNRGDLAVLVEGDSKLFNQYGVMAVSQAKHPHVRR